VLSWGLGLGGQLSCKKKKDILEELIACDVIKSSAHLIKKIIGSSQVIDTSSRAEIHFAPVKTQKP